MMMIAPDNNNDNNDDSDDPRPSSSLLQSSQQPSHQSQQQQQQPLYGRQDALQQFQHALSSSLSRSSAGGGAHDKDNQDEDDTASQQGVVQRTILVHGPSGCGKTALVEHALQRHPGVWIVRGKSDQVFLDAKNETSSSKSMTALRQALEATGQHLVHAERAARVLGDHDTLQQLLALKEILWKEARVLHVVSSLHHFVTTTSDEEEDTIRTNDKDDDNNPDDHHHDENNKHPHKQPPPAQQHETGQSTTARWTLAILALLRGITTRLHQPLCLFVDDLQWADAASREILSSVCQQDLPGLAVILAYRDDPDSNANAALGNVLGNVVSSANVLDLPLSNLPLSAVQAWMADLFFFANIPSATDKKKDDKDEAEEHSNNDNDNNNHDNNNGEEEHEHQRKRLLWQDLSQTVYNKTQGNCFFILKYLELLQRQGLLRRRSGNGNDDWEWTLSSDESTTATTTSSSGVVQVVQSQMARLPRIVQRLAQVAACLGFATDASLLERLFVVMVADLNDNGGGSSSDNKEKSCNNNNNHGKDEFATALATATDEHILVEVGSSRSNDEDNEDEDKKDMGEQGTLIRFTHDRVQQAAYESIGSTKDRARLHLQIGRQLCALNKTDHDVTKRYTMETANQYNQGSSQLDEHDDDDERLQLVALNIQAALMAQSRGSFALGADYLIKAKDLTLQQQPRFWRHTYPLMVKLYTHLIDSEYSRGRFDSTIQHINQLLKHAKDLDDQVAARFVRMQIYGAQRQFGVALQEARQLLTELGERLPRATGLNVMLEYLRTSRLARKRTDDDLLFLAPIASERIRWVVKILKVSYPYGWNDDQNYAGLALFRLMRVTLLHGSCESTPFAFVGYGSMIAGLGHESEGFRFARLAIAMLGGEGEDKNHNKIVADPPTMLICHAMLHHLRRPAAGSLDPLLAGYRAGLQFGDTYYGALCIGAYPLLYIFCGLPLGPFIHDMRKFGQELRICGQLHCLDYILPMLHLALNLSGESEDPYTLTWESCKKEEIYADNRIPDDAAAPSIYLHYTCAFNSYIMGDTETALAACKRANFRTVAGTHFSNSFHSFIDGLVYMAAYRRDRQKQNLKVLLHIIKKLESLARRQKVNCLGMLLLLVAEKNSLRAADVDTGKKSYDLAISQFARSGFTHFAAIAYERAGEFTLERHDNFWAKHYLSHAADKYHEWGAHVKAAELRRLYPFVRSTAGNDESSPNASSTSTIMSLRGRQQFDADKDAVPSFEFTEKESAPSMNRTNDRRLDGGS